MSTVLPSLHDVVLSLLSLVQSSLAVLRSLVAKLVAMEIDGRQRGADSHIRHRPPATSQSSAKRKRLYAPVLGRRTVS